MMTGSARLVPPRDSRPRHHLHTVISNQNPYGYKKPLPYRSAGTIVCSSYRITRALATNMNGSIEEIIIIFFDKKKRNRQPSTVNAQSSKTHAAI